MLRRDPRLWEGRKGLPSSELWLGREEDVEGHRGLGLGELSVRCLLDAEASGMQVLVCKWSSAES